MNVRGLLERSRRAQRDGAREGYERSIEERDDGQKRSRSAGPWMPKTKQKVAYGC